MNMLSVPDSKPLPRKVMKTLFKVSLNLVAQDTNIFTKASIFITGSSLPLLLPQYLTRSLGICQALPCTAEHLAVNYTVGLLVQKKTF